MKFPNRAATSPIGCVASKTRRDSRAARRELCGHVRSGSGHEGNVQRVDRQAKRDQRERRQERRIEGLATGRG